MSNERTGTTLPYETAAMRGDPMPEGLKSYDCTMFQNLSLLYQRYRKGMIDREQAIKEKKTLLDAYRSEKFGYSVLEENIAISKRLESAAAEYVYTPCVETADKMYRAFYGIKRNENPRLTLEEFLNGKN
jgi:hypothetical protein